MTSVQPHQRWGGEPGTCKQCGLKVYAAEEVIAGGQKWHRLCLKCAQCNKLLGAGSVTNHDEDVFCSSCYSKLFGPRGYGFSAGGAGLLVSEERVIVGARPLGQSASVNKASGGSNGSVASGTAIETAPSPNEMSKNAATGDAVAGLKKSLPVSAAATSQTCFRCSQTVYAAERVIGGGHSYHKRCFKCSACSRQLDSYTLCERDEQIFCKACYGRQFGPKGFGFGIPTMNTTE